MINLVTVGESIIAAAVCIPEQQQVKILSQGFNQGFFIHLRSDPVYRKPVPGQEAKVEKGKSRFVGKDEPGAAVGHVFYEQ